MAQAWSKAERLTSSQVSPAGIWRVSQPYVFQLASQRTQWLSTRETLIAGNVANANTPGYQATDLQPFSAVLASTQVSMATTNPLHMTPSQEELNAAHAVDEQASDETISGNSVRLENEMMKLGEVNRDYSMSTNIKRALHQMIMSVLK
jgi:flagellar basal-body rod protein FlgB